VRNTSKKPKARRDRRVFSLESVLPVGGDCTNLNTGIWVVDWSHELKS